jgi:elongation factor Ts
MTIKITAELVKELRDRTNISVMQCKNALEEADGDMEKALILLKNKSSSISDKKSERITKDGIVVIAEKEDKVILLALHTETDFVARNADFVDLANKLAKLAIDSGIDQMKDKSKELIDLVVQKVGEKIELGEVVMVEGNILGSYVHNNKNATVVSLLGGDKELAKDVAMHITAMKPSYIKTEDIHEEDKAKVIELFEKEIKDLDKPEEIKKKILDGKIKTYFNEQTLMEQPYIKNPDLTIKQLLSLNKATLINYIRSSIG